MNIQEIGQKIRQLRLAQSITLEQLSDDLQISISHLSLIERGKRTPSFENLSAITVSLGLPVSVFILLCVEDNDARKNPVIKELKSVLKTTLSRDEKFRSIL